MKRYEIRQIEGYERQIREAVYFADEIEIKRDTYGYYEAVEAGAKAIGFYPDGKTRRKWLSTSKKAYQIIDNENGEVINLKSQPQIMEELGLSSSIK